MKHQDIVHRAPATGDERPPTTLGLTGRRVVVTGAAGGLGRAFAAAFAAAGARILAADIDLDAATKTVSDIVQAGGEAHACKLDVADAVSTTEMAVAVRRALGGVDVLINNAAIYAGLRQRRFEEIPESEWDRVMSVNVKGVWMATRAFVPLLREARGGAIVNVSSATVMSGSPNWLHYVASKGAIIAMTRALARELGTDKITVNALAPGFTLTEASLGLMEDAAEYGVARGALKRPAQPTDMVGAALFLASPHAEFMTGQTLIVDGGRQFI
jgi:NAD(P)-dependent dehydrogenase (short-subunit alcohol dehydrogenase family)